MAYKNKEEESDFLNYSYCLFHSDVAEGLPF